MRGILRLLKESRPQILSRQGFVGAENICAVDSLHNSFNLAEIGQTGRAIGKKSRCAFSGIVDSFVEAPPSKRCHTRIHDSIVLGVEVDDK